MDRGCLCQPRYVHHICIGTCPGTCTTPSFIWDHLCNVWGLV